MIIYLISVILVQDVCQMAIVNFCGSVPVSCMSPVSPVMVTLA